MFARHDPRHLQAPILDLDRSKRPRRLTAFRCLIVGTVLAVAAWTVLLGWTRVMDLLPLPSEPFRSPLQTHLLQDWVTVAMPALALTTLGALFGRLFIGRFDLQGVLFCAIPWITLVICSSMLVPHPDGGGFEWMVQPLWIWQWLPPLLAVPLGLAVGATGRSAKY